ncbi:MAG: hypothetical protein OXR66_03460 [Candidatus Woesearchaeota archaeon]|nr:hypothetical protein [Candidatus Woesearchaeota archaeon]
MKNMLRILLLLAAVMGLSLVATTSVSADVTPPPDGDEGDDGMECFWAAYDNYNDWCVGNGVGTIWECGVEAFQIAVDECGNPMPSLPV